MVSKPVSQMTKSEIVAALARRSNTRARQDRNLKTTQIKALHVKELARMHARMHAAQQRAGEREEEHRRYGHNTRTHGKAHARLAHGMRHGYIIGGF